MSDRMALLIIDVQSGIFSAFGPVYQSSAVLSRIKSLISRARSSSTPIIYIQHCSAPGGALEHGTPGWQIHPDVAPLPGEPVILKHAPDGFQGTTLQKKLKSLGVKKVIITGLQTEFCVDTTCRRASSLGYKVVLAADAHSTFDSEKLSASEIVEHHNNLLGTWFVELKKTSEIAFETAGPSKPGLRKR